jgi:hypothetical protein
VPDGSTVRVDLKDGELTVATAAPAADAKPQPAGR